MKQYLKDTQPCFDDVLLVPQRGSIESRSDVDLTMTLGVSDNPKAQITLHTPIIASPMDTVCDTPMIMALDRVGALGILHRFMPRHHVISRAKHLHELGVRFGISISTRDTEDPRYIEQLLDVGARIICIDTANGHSALTTRAVSRLRKMVPDNCHIMAGNVSTMASHRRLLNSGADSVRVGIGGGAACSTRIVSGHGMPTLASVIDCSFPRQESIIADGGIRNTGDMVKSFAAGASAVMLGSLLAGHYEAPKILNEKGERTYRGMASASAQMSWSGGYKSVEGVEGSVPSRGSVEDTIKTFRMGIASGCSYTGVDTLRDLFEEALYVTVSNLTAQESRPRI